MTLFSARVDDELRAAADQDLVRLMAKHQGLVVGVLMGSELPSSTLIEALATYNPCLILPEQCDPKVAGFIQRAFPQERKKRGWPEALLGVQDLPSVSLPEEASGKDKEEEAV